MGRLTGESLSRDKWVSFAKIVSAPELHRGIRDKGRLNGGFYFKNRVGEELAAPCLEACRKQYVDGTEGVLQNMSRIMNHFAFNETPDGFVSKLDGATDVEPDVTAIFKRGWAYFQSWLRTPRCTAAQAYMRALLAVLSYKANRPYEHWYGEETKCRIDAQTKDTLLALGQQMSAQGGMEGYAAEVMSYLKPQGKS